ncbi:MAG: DUF11 domain-containing protein, partial [Bacteroidota bacterium]
MKKAICVITFMASALVSQAQTIYNNGARIQTVSGTYMVVSGGSFSLTSENATYPASLANLKIGSGATLSLTAASYLKIGGNLQNSGTLNGATGSKVTFANSTAQVITGTGATTFSNLTLDNNGGLTLTDAGITVNGILDFTNGLLTTGTNTATIGASGSIVNAGSSKYVNGKLARTFSSTGSKVFPIGKGSNYRQLSFNYTAISGTSIVTADQTESGMSGTLPGNTALLTTGRYWTISQSGGTNLQYYLSLDASGYSTSNSVFMLKKDAGTISSYATTTPNYSNAIALTTFGDFALGQTAEYADLSIIKTTSPTAIAGQNVTYAIVVTNNGPIDAQAVSVTDVLPAGLTFVSATPSVGSWSASNWTIGTLANSGEATLILVAKVNSNVAHGTSIINTATVSSTTTDPEPDNNSMTNVFGVITSADLSIMKTTEVPTVIIGENVTYTITVTNNGPSDAQAVVANDVLPAGLTFVSATPLTGSWTSPNWTIGTLANEVSATITLVARV